MYLLLVSSTRGADFMANTRHFEAPPGTQPSLISDLAPIPKTYPLPELPSVSASCELASGTTGIRNMQSLSDSVTVETSDRHDPSPAPTVTFHCRFPQDIVIVLEQTRELGTLVPANFAGKFVQANSRMIRRSTSLKYLPA